MKKLFKIILGAILLLLLVGLLILGYLGFIPGLNKIFGSDKPRDLGVSWTQADQDSAFAQTGTKVEYLAPGSVDPSKSLQYEGSVKLDTTLSDKQLMALMASNKWIYNPIGDLQVKLNEDGTGEASGVIRVDNLVGYAATIGVPADQIDYAQKFLRTMSANPPFYVKGTGSVVNNQYQFNLNKIELGRLPVPEGLYAGNVIGDYVTERVKFFKEVNVRSAKFGPGGLKLDADYPAIEKQMTY